MIDDSAPENLSDDVGDAPHDSGRTKQKIRIKYRQKVKIKQRPRGYKIQRYWKKNQKNLISSIILVILLGATAYMVVQVVKQQIEQNKYEKNQKLRVG